MSRKTQQAARARLFALVIAALVVAVLAWAGGSLVKDRMDHAAATARAKHDFIAIRARIVTRLRQRDPIQLGAVWATHTGRICGLVNGEGSFGGLSGMTPFFTDGGGILYAPETDPVVFGRGWMECGRDMWVEIVPGSTQEGYCATREGASHCHMTSARRPEEP